MHIKETSRASKNISEEHDRVRRRRDRLRHSTFYIAVAALLIPVWLFPYFPSEDGPSHLLNSHVFLAYSRVAIFQQAFTRHIPWAGNLAGQALGMLLLQMGVPPAACDKVLVTVCIVALALAFRYALRGARPASIAGAFFVLPFLYNWPVQMGFWSFSLGVPFVLVSVGLCLRYAGRWDAKGLTLLFLSVAGVYACHPIPWAASGLVVTLLVISFALQRVATEPPAWRQTLAPICIFVPFAIPNLLFAHDQQIIIWEQSSSLRERLWPFYNMTAVRLFEGDTRAAQALFLFLAAISVFAVVMRARQKKIVFTDRLLAISALFAVTAMWSPGRIGEGTFIEVRLLLFAYLVWALWLAITLPPRLAKPVAVVITAITAWQIVARIPSWREFNRDLVQVVNASKNVAPGATICQHHMTRHIEVWPMDHAVDLLENKDVVDVRDYEAGRTAFWTEFRPGYYLDENYLAPSSEQDLEGAVRRFERRTGRTLDYLMLTDMTTTPEQSLQRVLPSDWKNYRLIGVSEPASIAAVFQLRHAAAR